MADMRRSLLTAVAMAMVLAAGGATSAQADQAVLLDFVGPISPGETEEWSFTLAIARHGIPNVAYENAESFAVGETVTAVITPVVEPKGFGSLELVSGDTLTGTTSDNSNTGEFGELEFAPQVTLRYTAPSMADLGCTDHPGDTFRGHVGVLADFSGDAGTLAHIDPTMGGQGWVGAAVPVEVTCPLADSTPAPDDVADATLPPTDASPARTTSPAARLLALMLGVSVTVSLMVVGLSRLPAARPGRGRRS